MTENETGQSPNPVRYLDGKDDNDEEYGNNGVRKK